MANIELSVNGVEYPPLERRFIRKRLENSTDVVTLANSMYTDFADNQYNQWQINYDSLTKAQYDDIVADYEDQKTSGQYPTISIPYYGVSNVPARMYLNDQDVADDCGTVENIQITFRETAQLP